MPAATDYIHRYQLPRCIVRGVDASPDIFVADLAGVGVQLADASTYTLLSGSRIVHTTTALTYGTGATVGEGSLTSPILAATTAAEDLTDRLVERWDTTIAGASVSFTRPVYLVRHPLHAVITDTDLLALHSDLAELRDPDQTTYEEQRSDAWVTLQTWLIQKGHRPQLIVDDWQLRGVHQMLTLEIIFRDFASSVGDGRYSTLASDYRAQSVEAFSALALTYDFNEDGAVNEGEQSAATGSPVTLLSVPWGWNG
jgi:hypothetical protein